MTEWKDRRLYLFASLPARVNRFISLSEDLAPAWKGRSLVPAPRRHLTLLDLSLAEVPLSEMIRLARRFVTDALPEAFHMNVDELVIGADRALLCPSEPLVGALGCQGQLLRAAARRGLDLPDRVVAPRPHVTLGHGYAGDHGATRIDGISWRVEDLRLVLSHGGGTIHEELDRWHLPERRLIAA